MTRLSSLAILAAAAVAFSGPALAKVSVQSAEVLCKNEVTKQQPTAKSVKADKEATRATSSTFTYLLKVKNADDTTTKLYCTVDRATEAVSGINPLN